MDEDNQSAFHVAAYGSSATGAEDHRRDLGDCARAAGDALASFQSLGSDERPLSNGQLWKGMNALIEAMKSALEGDGVSARSYIGSASALLVDTGRERDIPAALSKTPAVRSCGGLAPWQVRRLKTHMEENLGGAIYCEDLARLVCLSLSHFMRAFKESFGCAPHAFLIRRRMQRAQGLMLSTDEALGQIALACGLADQSHLTRLFQKWVGESPAAWRRARTEGQPRPCPRLRQIGGRSAAAAVRVHHQPGGVRKCECGGAHSPDCEGRTDGGAPVLGGYDRVVRARFGNARVSELDGRLRIERQSQER